MPLETIIAKALTLGLPPWAVVLVIGFFFAYQLFFLPVKWLALAATVRLLTKNGDEKTRLKILRILNKDSVREIGGKESADPRD